MSEVYISSATRTAVASFNGSLASLPAHDLGKFVSCPAAGFAPPYDGYQDAKLFGSSFELFYR